jgi:ankyrin repeat protein
VAFLAVLLSMAMPSIGYAAAAEAAGADVADAAQKKDLGSLRTLVQRKVDVNTAQPDGTTALHWAVVWNSDEAINLLLRAGANVKARNRYGATALSEAVSAGSVATVEAIL